jgi:hypothetical protein
MKNEKERKRERKWEQKKNETERTTEVSGKNDKIKTTRTKILVLAPLVSSNQ